MKHKFIINDKRIRTVSYGYPFINNKRITVKLNKENRNDIKGVGYHVNEEYTELLDTIENAQKAFGNNRMVR